jgi:hypothetical protein
LSKQNILDNNEMLDLLEPKTRKLILEDFLAKHYMKGSHKNYISAISRMFYFLEKISASELTVKDFKKIVPNKNKSPQETYCESFFRFLFAYNHLRNSDGFEDIWTKQSSIKHFEALKRNLNKKVDDTEDITRNANSLNFKEITLIQNVLSRETQNIEIIKMGFVWYMLFETDCSVEELKKLKSDQYDNGYITTYKRKNYRVPEKYRILFEHLNERVYSGFYNLNDWTKKLGKIVGIENLYPSRIKLTRKQNLIPCGNCGKKYMNISKNWKVVNNRIVCMSCYESLKKNEFMMCEDLVTEVFEHYDVSYRETEISSIVYTFDELKNKIPNSINYRELQEFQERIGKLGEAFVYEYECEKLIGSEYEGKVDNTKALDPSNGYDILSYDLDGTELYIEVKTSINNNSDFFITANELNTFKKMKQEGKKYLIYKVTNILSENKNDIRIEKIEDIFNSKEYELIEISYKVKKK